jgi:CrcB protein
MLWQIIGVCAGGAVGSGLRFALVSVVQHAVGTSFPYGTWAVNVLGSMMLGAIMHIAACTHRLTPGLQVALTSGLLGGFTTYSSFAFETFRQLHTHHVMTALGYVAATIVGCLLACWLGWASAGMLVAASR